MILAAAFHPLIEALAPEIILAIGAGLAILIGAGRVPPRSETAFALALISIVAALYATVRLEQSPADPHPGLSDDPLVYYVRLGGLWVGLLILLANRHVPGVAERGEFFGLLLLSLAGVLLVALANDLVLLFLALELVSVPTYVLVGLSRTQVRAQEATVKYFFLGAFAAAITLYGMSFLYGAAGTTALSGGSHPGDSIAVTLSAPNAMRDPLIALGLVLTLGGLAFKLAAVPLHFYVADVYQGAASPVAGLLGFVPKFAGFVALVRLLSLSQWGLGDAVFWLLWILAAATMLVGNTLALMQTNVKRLLAYSGVAHSGYMLVALLAGPGAHHGDQSPLRNGLTALLFYAVIYGVMNLGAFAALACFRRPNQSDDDSVETLDDLAGAARAHPWPCLALAVCVVGLMGLPPGAGFLGKFYVFSAALSTGDARSNAMLALVILGVLNSAVAAAYYLRIVAVCYLGRPVEGLTAVPCRALRASLLVCAALVLILFAAPNLLYDRAQTAAAQIRATPHVIQAAAPSAEPGGP